MTPIIFAVPLSMVACAFLVYVFVPASAGSVSETQFR